MTFTPVCSSPASAALGDDYAMRPDALLSVLFVCFISPALGQDVFATPTGEPGGALNRFELLDRSNEVRSVRSAAVSPDDTIIPQLVNGAGWKTTIILHNLDSRTHRAEILFFDDIGRDLPVPLVGFGPVRKVDVILAAGQTVTLETAAEQGTLLQGWAYLRKENRTDMIGGLAVLRQAVPGRPDQEAVVPIVTETDNSFVLLFDNSDFTAALAVANPSATTATIQMTVKGENGTTLYRDSLQLPGLSHTAFTVPQRWPITTGLRGAIEFSSNLGIGAMGLRFGGSAFTSFHALRPNIGPQPTPVFPMVPAIADIALAGQPDGVTVQSDSSPLNSPVLVPVGLAAGRIVHVSATGSVSQGASQNPNIAPSGSVDRTSRAGYRSTGIAYIDGPSGALIGVFLGPAVPSTTATPPDVDYQGAAADLPTLRPLLQQPFYIGSGFTRAGQQRDFVVPEGATRLFLGVLDGYGANHGNQGSFNVTVTVE